MSDFGQRLVTVVSWRVFLTLRWLVSGMFVLDKVPTLHWELFPVGRSAFDGFEDAGYGSGEGAFLAERDIPVNVPRHPRPEVR